MRCLYQVRTFIPPRVSIREVSLFFSFAAAKRFSTQRLISDHHLFFSANANFDPFIADKPLELASPITQTGKDPSLSDLQLSPQLDDEFDIFGGRMSVPGGASPFIKDEETEDWFNNPMIHSPQHLNMNPHQQRFGQMPHGSVDPSELQMQNQTSFNGQQNNGMSNSFNMGNAAIGDDELLDLDLNENSNMQGHAHGSRNHNGQEEMSGFFNQNSMHHNNQQMHQIFNTNTPNGDPIQSPFLHGNFNYNNYQQFQQQMSPHMRPTGSGGAPQEFPFGATRSRSSLPHMMDRKPSDSRSPMTPKTPALGGLNLGGTPDSGSLPSQPISAISHRHQKSLSGQWDSTPGLSYVDSPAASPGHPMNHAQISEVLKSGKHASLPSKVDAHHANTAYQSQEAKRRRRRESHNMVERRRRDNINERIQELSHLVPNHRLEDEKVRKHLATNGPGPLSPTLAATSLSSSQPATSLLANGGRRATGAGSITMGIPMEEKDKGPNKGDILNGSVSWCRDLMWALYKKIQEEEQLRQTIQSLGGTWPFEETEDEKRMRSELMEAMEKNDPESFDYSRANGSGLRVPKYTNLAGEPLNPLSNGSMENGVQTQFWANNNGGQGNLAFKEEDEYGMQLEA